MSQALDDLIESELSGYTLGEKTKALVLTSLKDSQGFIAVCNKRDARLRTEIATKRAEVGQLVSMLRQNNDNKIAEIATAQEMFELLKPRKIQ